MLCSAQWEAMAAQPVWNCILVMLSLQFGKVTVGVLHAANTCHTLNMSVKDK
jgi:hypothetical protein